MKTAPLAIALLLAVQAGAQSPVDTSKIGPKVGTVAPAFSGPDQTGATRSLASAAGPKGTMLVFFRSADW
jgi:hypothetical protein